MNGLIQTLNSIPDDRLIGYGIFIIVALGIIVEGIVSMYRIHQKNKYRNQI